MQLPALFIADTNKLHSVLMPHTPDIGMCDTYDAESKANGALKQNLHTTPAAASLVAMYDL